MFEQSKGAKEKMNGDDFSKKFDKFTVELKKKDEKLYYDFLHIYDDYLEQWKRQEHEINKKILAGNEKIIKLDLEILKHDNVLHDSHIETKHEINSLKKESAIMKQEFEQKAEKYYYETRQYLIKYADKMGVAFLARPRYIGLMCFVFGKSFMDKLVKAMENYQENKE